MITKESKIELYQRLVGVLGKESALTLMEHLPPAGWTDVATKQDIEMLRLELRAEMHEFRGELRTEMHELRAEMQGLRADMHREMQKLSFTIVTALVAWTTIVLGVAKVF